MKVHLKKLIPTLLLVSGSILLNNCAQHEDCEEESTYHSYSISPNTLNQIPYRKDGLDTLIYISTDGDTAVLYGQGVHKSYVEKREDENPSPDCNNYINHKCEVVDFSYQGNNSLLKTLTFYTYNYVSTATIAKSEEVFNYSPFLYYEVAFGEASGDYCLPCMSSEQNYKESVIVDNKTLPAYKVYAKTDSLIAYYNKNYGAIKLEYKTKIWIKKM